MRKSGVLMPIFSLPSSQSVGTLGKGAYDFARFLSLSGQKVWQILPLCPVDYTFSPYQSCSCFAGNTLFIDFPLLVEDGLLTDDDIKDIKPAGDKCDYRTATKESDRILNLAFLRFDPDDFREDYSLFLSQNGFWLEDFALYTAIKEENGLVAWNEFPLPLQNREKTALEDFKKSHKREIDFVYFTQFIFWRQYTSLKEYANSLNVELFGDMPIYAAYDSADCWAHREDFMLADDNRPTLVAGTPPDAFSAEGQVWGSPLYDFAAQSRQAVPYRWWKERIRHALSLYDLVRIDHFRAFEAFFAIPGDTLSAKDGKWIKGPDIAFFEEIERALGPSLPIVAEDLGLITNEVKALLQKTGFAGMRVLQFAFDGNKDNPYLPYNLIKNCVAYIGTHDNATLCEFEKRHPTEAGRLKEYIGKTSESFNWATIRLLVSCVADTVILTMQDIMFQNENHRINTPGTVSGNWEYRIDPSCPNDWLAGILKELTEQYGR